MRKISKTWGASQKMSNTEMPICLKVSKLMKLRSRGCFLSTLSQEILLNLQRLLHKYQSERCKEDVNMLLIMINLLDFYKEDPEGK